ncbi:MAG: hypothetical protein J2P50_12470 [Hyphomicrobiaceae bacterium]|nr:hypothetical protein [Hyphomicrobiaceae bacterium]
MTLGMRVCLCWLLAATALAISVAHWPAAAQKTPQAPAVGDAAAPANGQDLPTNTTVVPRSQAAAKPSGAPGQVSVVAHLTDASPPITQGLVWRVFRDKAGPGGEAQLVSTSKEASPTLKLEPGIYHINVALGRANLTRKVTVASEQPIREKFVLNAGGLRIVPVLTSGEPANEKLVIYDVESDERDEYGQRVKVVTGARAGLVLRLNAGNYSIVSTYGDANAVARADVSVEAGKLSEVTLAHAAARVSFKLVTRGGGDAIADTQWSVLNGQGEAIKQSSGALPTHVLAPGSYVVRAKHAGRSYSRDFAVKAGDNALVEVIIP